MTPLDWVQQNLITIIGWVVSVALSLFALGKKSGQDEEHKKSTQDQITVLNSQQLQTMAMANDHDKRLQALEYMHADAVKDIEGMIKVMEHLTQSLDNLNATLSKQAGEFGVIKDLFMQDRKSK